MPLDFASPVPYALGGADIAMLVGLPVAAIVYLLMCRSIDLEHEKRQPAAADRGPGTRGRQGVCLTKAPEPSAFWSVF